MRNNHRLIHLILAVAAFGFGPFSPLRAADYKLLNDYAPAEYPGTPPAGDFELRLDRTVVIAPAGVDSSDLTRRLGVAEARPAAGADFASLAGRDLIIAGNITNNPLAEQLYARRYAFADAEFPGPGGYVIHPAPLPDGGRALVVGASDAAGLRAGLDALAAQVAAGATTLPAIRALKTDLEFPKPPADPAAALEGPMAQPRALMLPYATIAQWGLQYALTGEQANAEAFKVAFRAIHARGKTTGRWISEPWTNVYFNLWKIMIAWELICDDPAFSADDRLMIEQALWGMTRFCDWLPNLDPDQAPPDEPRQNHTTFLGLSLFFSHRYFAERRGLAGLDSYPPKFRNAFHEGQAATFVPNDDAGGYINYAPLHTLTAMLATGDRSYIDSGKFRQVAELTATTLDNRTDYVGFGDVGGYKANKPGSSRPAEARAFLIAGHFYDDPGFRWLADWMGKGRGYAFDDLWTGTWADGGPASQPEFPLGIQFVQLDEPALRWFALRAPDNADLPRSDAPYYHKLTMRGGFDPADEFLLLDGLSAMSHGHHDGNTISRLTWRDRIWLFDLDYIKYPARYHNGLTITRDGRQADPPPLARLDVAAEAEGLAAVRSTVENWSGADWTRTILWRKGQWFLVVDEVTAREAGDYRLDLRWRTRGDQVSLEDDGSLLVRQGSEAFTIIPGDDAPRRLDLEPDGARNNWSAYPYGDATAVMLAREERPMAAGERVVFASLMTVGPADTMSRLKFRRADAGRFVIEGGADRSTAIALDPIRAGMPTELQGAAIVATDPGRSWSFGTARLPFTDGEDLVAAHATDHDQRLIAIVQLWMSRLRQHSSEPLPRPWPAPPLDFGFAVTASVDSPATITATAAAPDGTIFAGDAAGHLRRLDADRFADLAVLPAAAPVAALAAADLDGDGGADLAAGDRDDNLLAVGSDGRILWQHKMTPYYGADAIARDIQIAPIDASGKPVVLAANGGWKVYAVEPSGEIRWEAMAFYHPLTRLGVCRAGSEFLVVVGTEYHSPFNVFNARGELRYHAWEEMGSEFISHTDFFGIHLTDLLMTDIDGDGNDEMIFGTLSGRVFAVRLADGAKIWEENAGSAVTKLAKLSERRIAVGTEAGDVLLLATGGQRVARAELGATVTSLIVVDNRATGTPARAAATAEGDVTILRDDLRIRAWQRLNAPVLALQPAAADGENSADIWAITAHGATRLRWTPPHIRESWHY